MKKIFCSVFLSILFLTNFSFATSNLSNNAWKKNIPDELKPWIGWVSKDIKDVACPGMFNNFTQKQCAFSTRLSINVVKDDLIFVQKVYLYKDDFVRLIGDRKLFPKEVQENNEKLPIINQNKFPYVFLKKGMHEIKGIIELQPYDTEISIPQDVAIINFSKNDKEEKLNILNDKLQLSEYDQSKSENDDSNTELIKEDISIQVRRILEDDIPFKVITILKLNVSGKERDVNLGKIVFPGSRIISLESGLNAKMNDNKDFIFRVLPGVWEIKIKSIFDNIVEKIAFFQSTEKFPDDEMWGYTLNNVLRTTKVNGITPISPENFGISINNNKNMKVYMVQKGDVLELKEQERAPLIDSKNELSLKRHMWLNFKGDGYFVQDNLAGSVKNDSFLGIENDLSVAKMQVDGSSVPIVVNKETSKNGINLHQGYVNIMSEGRYKNISKFTVAPFNFVSGIVNINLELPVGYKIFNISNVDDKNFSWVGKWNLLKLFYLCLTFCLVYKVFSLKAGILALVSMILLHDSELSIYFELILISLFHYIHVLLKNGECKKFYYNIFMLLKNSILIFIIVSSVNFVIGDIRLALYPQLKFNIMRQSFVSQPRNNYDRRLGMHKSTAGSRLEVDGIMKTYEESDEEVENDRMPLEPVREVEVRKIKNTSLAYPTGFGVPIWRDMTGGIQISKSNVSENDYVKICYLTPTINIIISFIRAICLGFLFVLLINQTGLMRLKEFVSTKTSKYIFIGLVYFVSLFLFNASSVFAEPSQETLKELKSYVEKNINPIPSCTPYCASFGNASINVKDGKGKLNLKVNVLEDSVFPIIKNNMDYIINSIMLDKEYVDKAIKTQHNDILLFLSKGVHHVKIKFTLINPDIANFVFLQPITKMNLNLIGYEYLGEVVNVENFKLRKISDLNAPENKLMQENKNNNNTYKNNLKLIQSSYYTVTKEIYLGNGEFNLTTKVQRLGNVSVPSTLELKLIKDEKVLSDDVDVKDEIVRVDFDANKNYRVIKSILPLVDNILLKSQDLDFVFEKWKVSQNESWQVSYSGVPEIINNKDRYWIPRKHEQLIVSVVPIKNSEAPTKTITKSEIQYKFEGKNLFTNLELVIRSSHGEKYELTFPKEFNVESCYIDKVKLPCLVQDNINMNNKSLFLELKPTEQTVFINFKSNLDWKFKYTLPKFDTKVDSVNSIIKLNLKNNINNRLLLWISGPKMGPRVLFWISIPILLLLSVFFTYGLRTEIKFYEWFFILLGINFIQSYVPAILLVIWLILGAILFYYVKNKENFIYRWSLRLYILLGVVAIIGFFWLIKLALIGSIPNMWIMGNGSYMNYFESNLVWYEDILGNILPMPEIVSININFYKIFIIIWALWISRFIIKYVSDVIKKMIAK